MSKDRFSSHLLYLIYKVLVKPNFRISANNGAAVGFCNKNKGKSTSLMEKTHPPCDSARLLILKRLWGFSTQPQVKKKTAFIYFSYWHTQTPTDKLCFKMATSCDLNPLVCRQWEPHRVWTTAGVSNTGFYTGIVCVLVLCVWVLTSALDIYIIHFLPKHQCMFVFCKRTAFLDFIINVLCHVYKMTISHCFV